MNKIDTLRHMAVFSAEKFGNIRVDVIGAGATGSKIAMSIAKLGISNLHVWDFDKIEEHNIANQIYNIDDIGYYKIDATAAAIREATGLEIHTHKEEVNGSQKLGNIVFLLTDTMSSRKEIWEKGLKMKLNTKLIIETRMGADEGRVYTFNPCKLNEGKAWEDTLYEDKEAAVSACGATPTVGPTADVISGMAVWQLIKWQQSQEDPEVELESEIIFTLNPNMIISRNF